MKKLIALAGILTYAGMATAQVLEIPSASGDAGTTITITAAYTQGTDVASFNADVQYDVGALGAVTLTCPPPAPVGATVGCNDSLTADSFRIGAFTIPSANITSGNVAEISWDVPPGTAPGNYPLVLVNDVFTMIDGTPAAGTTNVGIITVNAPAGAGFYTSTPAAGGDLDLGSAIVGNTTTPQVNLNVSNVSPDTDFDVTAIAGDAQLNTPAGATVPFGGNVDFPFDCTPTGRGDQSGNFTVTHDAANGAASPVGYTFTCAGLSPNVAAAPLTVNLVGVIGQANPTDTFDVTNAQDGFASDATGAVLNEQAVAEISVTAGLVDATISVDEVDPVTVSCSTAAPGMFTETLTLEYDDPVAPGGVGSIDIVVNCEIINELAEYESVPAPGSTLDFGAVLNGDTSAPLGVDIGNSDTDAVPNAVLDITNATITGPNAAVFTLVTNPAGTMIPAGQAPDGTDDAVVTCTPTDGFSTFTATLTISSNDPDGDATYPLTCDGDSDAALVSDPVPGTVSLGIIGPGGSADTTITLTNTGTTDDISLDSCTLTADPEITLVSPVAFPVAIAPGASTDIVLNCTPGSPGTFTGTLACQASDVQGTLIPLNYDLICSGQAVEVPTLSRLGLLAMIMALMAVGFIGFRLRQN